LEKLAPFEKFRSSGKEEARPGVGNVENGRKRVSANYIAWIYLGLSNIMHWVYFGHTTVTLNPRHTSDRPGPLCISPNEEVCVYIMYMYIRMYIYIVSLGSMTFFADGLMRVYEHACMA